ncbi:hypothetical protein BBK36DRAFT_147521 [Trichoderma citrinoviride]|uniref:Cytochrome b561 domain-containing protein n=1 Tax=Trichoderma citrinoviride TaxID=58853 RepID=A0A2T4AZP8_9HYPO|nr:hypothetical protein BBK36DRAFT_147521 [Trichoderma citrinoviride]PTB62540.1 hypothetical protein BBK36DRAFT_147521 [Trichoderma citrinoviride]
MAPLPDQFSSPGSVSYDSDTMVVGDGTWDFTKNTFLLPNLQGTDFDTTRYNGMGNRFSTLHQYHTIILAHGIMAAMVFLFLVPFSVMIARFYSREPGYAIRYHARLQVFSCLLLLASFILGFFAVGPKRSLSNPHHGIGVAIFVMFMVQLIGGRIVNRITKLRSLRVTLHQWLGRALAILGIVQIPLGLTLYGSPKVLFILYAVWMAFLLVLYFVLSYQAQGRREHYMSEVRSEAGNTRITESEYFSDHRDHEHSKLAWLGPLAAAAGLFALARGRNRDHRDDHSRVRSQSPSMRSRGPTVVSSRPSYFSSEKYSDLPPQRDGGGGGGGLLKVLGGAAAAFGAGKLFSNYMSRRDRRDEEYSAVSTETPHRNRSGRATTISEFNSEYTDDVSTIPPSRAPAPTQTASAYGGRRPSPSRSNVRSNLPRRDTYDDSEYSSYVSPSRRTQDAGGGGGGGFAKGVLATLGVGWLAKKIANRRARKEEDERLREEEEMRSGTQFSSRYSNTEYSSPVRRDSRRPPPQRRSTVTGTEFSDTTESTFDTQTELSAMPEKGRPLSAAVRVPPSTSALVPGDAPPPRRGERLSMPAMPSDPRGILAHSDGSASDLTSIVDRPAGRNPSRRQLDSERAAAEAAARASNLAAQQERTRFGSSTGAPGGGKRGHDDKDRNPVQPAQPGPSTHLAPPHAPLPTASVSSIGSHGTWSEMTHRPSGPPTEIPDAPPASRPGAAPAVPPVVPSTVPPSTVPPTEIKEDKGNESAADNRRRRRMERRRASSSRPAGTDMYTTDTYTTDTYDDTERGF